MGVDGGRSRQADAERRGSRRGRPAGGSPLRQPSSPAGRRGWRPPPRRTPSARSGCPPRPPRCRCAAGPNPPPGTSRRPPRSGRWTTRARLSIVVVEVAATVDVVDEGGVTTVVVGSASAPLVVVVGGLLGHHVGDAEHGDGRHQQRHQASHAAQAYAVGLDVPLPPRYPALSVLPGPSRVWGRRSKPTSGQACTPREPHGTTQSRSAGPARAERSRERVSPGSSAAERDAVVMATKAIVGEKVGMTQVWDDENRVVPVTVLQVAPVPGRAGQDPRERRLHAPSRSPSAPRRPRKLTKPEAGQFAKAGVEPGPRLVELRLDDVERLRGRPGDQASTCSPTATASTSPPSARARASPAS